MPNPAGTHGTAIFQCPKMRKVSVNVLPAKFAERGIKVAKYRGSRFWGVWQGETLIAVTVYKIGATTVASLLEKMLKEKEAA
jgi:hypothetical protein